jgi:hypothetical protein
MPGIMIRARAPSLVWKAAAAKLSASSPSGYATSTNELVTAAQPTPRAGKWPWVERGRLALAVVTVCF